MTNKQPILDEIHAVRAQLLADSGGTLSELVARLQSEQAKSHRTILKTQRSKQSIKAARSGELSVESHMSPPVRVAGVEWPEVTLLAVGQERTSPPTDR